MHVDVTDIAVFIVVSLAAGRVAYSLTRDDIFRGLRESIWLRSAPEDGMIVERTPDGDLTRPARAYHPRVVPGSPDTLVHDYDPAAPFREPKFFGQLFECPYCMSFWTSAFAFVAWMILGDYVIYPALPLAIWAAANAYAVKGL